MTTWPRRPSPKERQGNSTPCYQIRQTPITLNAQLAASDLSLLKKALEVEGFTVNAAGESLSFSGVQKATGRRADGSWCAGKFSYAGKLDVESVKKSYLAQQVVAKFAKIGKVTQLSYTKFKVQLKTI